ncbi:MAG: hypothetical protein U0I51_23920 [Muricomes sp.]|nr:hypothetical protein [Muricomes sp.]
MKAEAGCPGDTYAVSSGSPLGKQQLREKEQNRRTSEAFTA